MNLFENILYVSDTSVDQEGSLARAVSLAENNQAELTVIDVVPNIAASMRIPKDGPKPDDLQNATMNARRQNLENLVEPYKKGLRISVEVLAGRKFLEAIRFVLRNDNDLLIKPAENPGFIERLFGSDDMQLLRNCPCPVWLTHASEKSKYQNILAAVDFDPDMQDTTEDDLNQAILGLAGSLAFSDFAALHVVHAWDAPGEAMIRNWADKPEATSTAYVEGVRSSHEAAYHGLRQELAARVGMEASAYLSAEFHLRRGAAATAIPDLAKRLPADLVVMGTVARTGIAGLLIGNTAEAVLEQLQCSVLAVKPPGFVSPVKLA